MKRLLVKISVVALVLSASLLVVPADTTYAAKCQSQGKSIFPSWYDDLCKSGTDQIMSPAEMGANDADKATATGRNIGLWASVLAMNIVKILLMVVGFVSLGFIIYGGFKYMTAGDSSAGTVAARKTITNAVIGLVISIMAVAIVNLVVGAITG